MKLKVRQLLAIMVVMISLTSTTNAHPHHTNIYIYHNITHSLTHCAEGHFILIALCLVTIVAIILLIKRSCI